MEAKFIRLAFAFQLLLYIFSPVSPIDASCPLGKYLVKGVVADHELKPVLGAKIFVFLDDNENSSVLATSASMIGRWSQTSDFAITDASGHFNFIVYLDTQENSPSETDICDRKPGRVNVFVLKQGYLSKRKEYKHNQFMLSGKGSNEITLGTIKIEQDIPIP